MIHLLVKIIKDTFLKEAGKFQCRKDEPKAFLMKFSTSIDYGLESGYRQVDLLLYAPANYVQVWTRERWTVIPLEDLDYDECDDAFIKEGKDYDEGASDWELIGDHDSGWVSYIESFLHKNRKNSRRKILTFERSDWYEIIDVPTEIIRQD